MSGRHHWVVAAAAISAANILLAAEPTAPQQPSAKSWVDEVKQPVDWFKWGGDLRLRHEFHENAITLNEDAADHIWSYNRYRARVWGSILPADDISINNRWTWEGRYWWEPEPREGFYDDYIIADQLNVQFKNLGDTNSTITVGRQDVILNDGWLVLEGTPQDGSKTIFFDAARAQYQFNERHGIDAAVLVQHAQADEWSPIIMGDDEAKLVEQDEVGAYIDYRFKPQKQTRYDAYFIYKHTEDPIFLPRLGDEGDVYTFGARAEHGFTDNISGRVEGAYQFGQRENGFTPSTGDQNAFGVNSRATYAFKDQMDNKLHMSFEFMSGDDPSTDDNEAFDPLWGRWPQFSELYVYTVAGETRIAEVTNLYRIGPTWEVSPTKKTNVSVSYYALFADERTYNTAAFGDGYFRGHLMQAFIRHKFNNYVSGHLWAEYLIPGDYYADNRDDDAVFLRAELNLSF